MAKNTNLHTAKKEKNDEFYTMLSDIEKELKHYKDHFKGKVIYCNCDDARTSNFFKHFYLQFNYYGLKKLICTGYTKDGHGTMCVYDGNTEIDLNNIPVTEMEGDGDFRSQECIELLKEADIVVTNPPFSLFREYVAQLVKYDKKYLVIGNKNGITYKEIFPLIKENKMWLGYSLVKEFTTPNNTTQKFGNIGWFTNLSHSKRHEELVLYKKFTPEEYPKYDNYFGWNVDKVSDIPTDNEIEVILTEIEYEHLKNTNYDFELIENINEYKAKIKNPVWGVPITFLDKYNPEQFEIVEFRKGNDGKDLIYSTFGGGDNPTLLQNSHSSMSISGLMNNPKDTMVNGQSKYARILIRRR